MRRPLTWREDWIIPTIFGVVQLTNIVFLLIGGQWAILWPSLGIIAAQLGIIAWAFLAGRRPIPGAADTTRSFGA